MTDYDFFTGDDVHLRSDPGTKGRISTIDSSYAFIRIGNEIVPYKLEDLELDKSRPLGIALFLSSVAIFVALVWILVV